MAARIQKVNIHGVDVEQIEYQGKWYTNVASRVKIAEQGDPAKVRLKGAGYNVTSVQFVQIGERWAYHCLVEYPAGSGVVVPGTSWIDLADKAGIEKAETSAIGRGLGGHGIAIEESIASAEEMSQVTDATDDDETPPAPPAPSAAAVAAAAATTASMPAATEHQMKLIRQVATWLGIDIPEVASAEEAERIRIDLDVKWSEELKRRRQQQRQQQQQQVDLRNGNVGTRGQ